MRSFFYYFLYFLKLKRLPFKRILLFFVAVGFISFPLLHDIFILFFYIYFALLVFYVNAGNKLNLNHKRANVNTHTH